LIGELGFSPEELATLMGVREETEYACYDFMEASELVGGVEDLANQLHSLPYPLMPDLPDNGNDLGSPEKWKRIYECSPDTIVVLLKDRTTVVGLWHCVAVHEHTYAAICQGKNVNASITERDIRVLAIPGNYDIYFVDLYIDAVCRNARTRRLLLRSFLDFVREHARGSIFFRRIAAHPAFHESQDICRELGFVEVCRHLTHKVVGSNGEFEPTPIVELILDPKKKTRFFSLDNEIRDLYLSRHSQDGLR
jgi:hypothetical protein